MSPRYDNQGVDLAPPPKPRGTVKQVLNWPGTPYDPPVEVEVPPPATCAPHDLARVAGRTCFRSMAEMEHTALKLLRVQGMHDGLDPHNVLMTAFLEDVVRLARQMGDAPLNYSMSVRPGTWTGP